MTDGDDAHAPRHAPLHRTGEYMRWLLGDLLLENRIIFLQGVIVLNLIYLLYP